MSNGTAASAPRAFRAPSALALCAPALLLFGEAVAVSLCFDAAVLLRERGAWAFVLGHSGDLLRVGIAALAATALVGGRRLLEGLGQLRSGDGAHAWLPFLLVHLAAYGLFFAVTAVVMGGRISDFRAPLLWFALWLLLGVMTAGLLALAAAPPAAWLRLVRTAWPALTAGALVGTAAWLAGLAAQTLWRPLAEGTLWLVQRLLSLVCAEVVCRPAEMVVGTPSFTVQIAPVCSGYEGMGLVLVFLGTYLWLFRRSLSFPGCLALLPVGVALIWLSNAVRIAVLVLIGSAGWPDVAVGGFHSVAGWLLFLTVSLGLVAVSARRPRGAADAARPSLLRDPTAAYLGPFLALLVTTMLSAAFAGKSEPFYWPRLVAALAVLWLFRDCYRGLLLSWSWQAVGLGVAAFAAWLLLARLAPASPEPEPSGLGLAVRLLGYLFVAPLVEELAFRGYLLRRLQAVDFLQVRREQVTWLAVAVSAVLFGALHGGRFLAGAAAGLLFALAFCRRLRVGDSVLAHAVTNGLLAIYAITTGSWWAWS